MNPGRTRQGQPWLAGLCVLQFLLLIVLTVLWTRSPQSLPHSAAKPYTATDAEPFFLGRPGPWGELEYARINIEPPDDFVPTGAESFDPTAWVFAGCSAGQLTELFNAADLTASQRAELLNPAAWGQSTNGIIVSPRPGLLLELNPQARRQIYSVLARSDLNPRQFQPYAFREGGFDDWFGQSGLSDPTLAWLKRLVYPRGSAICFSDLPELLPQIPTLAERRRLVKALWRNPTVLMKLRIRPDSNVDALTAYWARGWHVKDIGALLASLTEVPGGLRIDVAHLLPPFARRRLYSYPNPAAYSPAQAPDCYWTALNFFNDPPDDRFHEPAAWQQELANAYLVVAEPTFGDVILLQATNGAPIHAAVYVADDVVFTKNGDDFRQPWMLMKMDDLLACYHHTDHETIHTLIFRAKRHAD